MKANLIGSASRKTPWLFLGCRALRRECDSPCGVGPAPRALLVSAIGDIVSAFRKMSTKADQVQARQRNSALKRRRAARAGSLRDHTDSRLDLDVRRREGDTSLKKSNTYCSGFETRLSTHVNSIASISGNMKRRKTTPVRYGRHTL